MGDKGFGRKMRSAKTTGEPWGPVTRRTPDSKGSDFCRVPAIGRLGSTNDMRIIDAGIPAAKSA